METKLFLKKSTTIWASVFHDWNSSNRFGFVRTAEIKNNPLKKFKLKYSTACKTSLWCG